MQTSPSFQDDSHAAAFSGVTLAGVVRLIAGIAVWLLAMLGVLWIAQLDLGITHTICGPWGCGPRAEALIACHGFWLMLLAPPAMFAASRTATPTIQLVAFTAIAVAAAGMLVIAVQQAFTWLPMIRPGEPTYFVRRCLFVIVTTIELPLVQLGLLGLGGWAVVRRRHRRFRKAQTVIEPPAGDQR